MNIRFVSSLTPEDEDRLAPAVLRAVSAILDQFPIAYTLRIETASSTVFQHAHTGADDQEASALEQGRLGPALASVLRQRSPLP
jgi:hypothetical protein